jgi:hypothetical protein
MQPANRYISKIIKAALLVLFVSHYGGITLFYHAHQINGRTISHSHPYKNDAPKKHNHTSNGILVIHCFNEESFKPTSPLPVPEPVCLQKTLNRNEGTHHNLITARIEGTLLRAPPLV